MAVSILNFLKPSNPLTVQTHFATVVWQLSLECYFPTVKMLCFFPTAVYSVFCDPLGAIPTILISPNLNNVVRVLLVEDAAGSRIFNIGTRLWICRRDVIIRQSVIEELW